MTMERSISTRFRKLRFILHFISEQRFRGKKRMFDVRARPGVSLPVGTLRPLLSLPEICPYGWAYEDFRVVITGPAIHAELVAKCLGFELVKVKLYS